MGALVTRKAHNFPSCRYHWALPGRGPGFLSNSPPARSIHLFVNSKTYYTREWCIVPLWGVKCFFLNYRPMTM
jgi:hypothetical protein